MFCAITRVVANTPVTYHRTELTDMYRTTTKIYGGEKASPVENFNVFPLLNEHVPNV